MDFMKWLTALDEALYEGMSWLLFFPLTLWRAAVRPLAMMDYADRQLALPAAEQYAAALSPPLFLALALLVAHGLAAAVGSDDAIIANRHGLARLVTDDIGLIVLRVVVFAAFPLFAAARLVRRSGVALDRTSLRLPFYAQCYPAAVFALGMGSGVALAQAAPVRAGGVALVAVSLGWFAVVETRWFAARLGIGWVRAGVAALLGLGEGFALLLVVGFLFTR